jgi:hypothetical protein
MFIRVPSNDASGGQVEGAWRMALCAQRPPKTFCLRCFMAILILLNNFLHDFSAAGWLFCTVILWSMLRKKILVRDAGMIVIDTIKKILVLMRLSLGGIVVFGIIRALAYKSYEWNAAAGEGQVTLLIVKHILLLGVFIIGVIYYTRAKKIIKKEHENYE